MNLLKFMSAMYNSIDWLRKTCPLGLILIIKIYTHWFTLQPLSLKRGYGLRLQLWKRWLRIKKLWRYIGFQQMNKSPIFSQNGIQMARHWETIFEFEPGHDLGNIMKQDMIRANYQAYIWHQCSVCGCWCNCNNTHDMVMMKMIRAETVTVLTRTTDI